MLRTLCSLTENELGTILGQILLDCGYDNDDIIIEENFICAKGALPIALVAHLDTVGYAPPDPDFIFHDPVKNVYWSPDLLGADDRAGVYAILSVLQRGYRPSVIFTKGEEKGGIGAMEFVDKVPAFPDLKFLIELDRQGYDDAVYYQCDNKKFEKMITNYGFVTDIGSFTDISIIAPAWKVAAVNLSVGYIGEHSVGEFLMMDSLQSTIDKVCNILANVDKLPKYKYVAKKTVPFKSFPEVKTQYLADYQYNCEDYKDYRAF